MDSGPYQSGYEKLSLGKYHFRQYWLVMADNWKTQDQANATCKWYHPQMSLAQLEMPNEWQTLTDFLTTAKTTHTGMYTYIFQCSVSI